MGMFQRPDLHAPMSVATVECSHNMLQTHARFAPPCSFPPPVKQAPFQQSICFNRVKRSRSECKHLPRGTTVF